MKKITLIILINIIILVVCIFMIDYGIARFSYNQHINSVNKVMQQHKDADKEKLDLGEFRYTLRMKHFGEIFRERAKNFNLPRYQTLCTDKHCKHPIIVFGCSFAEGAFLEDDETFEYKLAKRTKRSVYNRGFCGFGISQMLYQTSQPIFYEAINDSSEPEFAIYIFLLDHLRRIYESKYGHINVYLDYEMKNGHLYERKNSFILQLNRLNIVKNIMKNMVFPKYMLNKKNDDANFDLIKQLFIESRNELRKKYPNIKFIIIKHPFGLSTSSDLDLYSLASSYTTQRWKELEDEGFIIVDLKDFVPVDITADEYTFPDGHPNAKAWDLIIDNMTKKLSL